MPAQFLRKRAIKKVNKNNPHFCRKRSEKRRLIFPSFPFLFFFSRKLNQIEIHKQTTKYLKTGNLTILVTSNIGREDAHKSILYSKNVKLLNERHDDEYIKGMKQHFSL